MLDILQFIFSSFWVFIGVLIACFTMSCLLLASIPELPFWYKNSEEARLYVKAADQLRSLWGCLKEIDEKTGLVGRVFLYYGPEIDQTWRRAGELLVELELLVLCDIEDDEEEGEEEDVRNSQSK